MFNQPPGHFAELPHPVKRDYLEHLHRELVRDMYQAIDQSSLDRFTFSFVDSLWNDLNVVVQYLDRLPEPEFRELTEIVQGLMDARNELRLARFLFDVEDITAIYRLVMRNKAVLRARDRLHRVLQVWPGQPSA